MHWLNSKYEDELAKITKINSLPKKHNYLIDIFNLDLFYRHRWFELIDKGFLNLWITTYSKKIKTIKSLESLHGIAPRQRFLVKDEFEYLSTMDFEQLKNCN